MKKKTVYTQTSDKTSDAPKLVVEELHVKLSDKARELFHRVRAYESETRVQGTYYTVGEGEAELAAELVDRGLAFYSVSLANIGTMKSAYV